MIKKNNHIVYHAKVDGETVYIGSGTFGREKHCNSGCSHVYELNKLHFQGAEIEVSVLYSNLTKEESLKIEKDLILKHRPRLNKNYLRSEQSVKMGISLKVSSLLLREFTKEFGCGFDKYKEPIREVIKFIGISNLIDGCYIPSEVAGRKYLKLTKARTFYRNLRSKDMKDRYEKVLNIVFEYERENCNIWLKLRKEVLDG